jgi:hypothetical protein
MAIPPLPAISFQEMETVHVEPAVTVSQWVETPLTVFHTSFRFDQGEERAIMPLRQGLVSTSERWMPHFPWSAAVAPPTVASQLSYPAAAAYTGGQSSSEICRYGCRQQVAPHLSPNLSESMSYPLTPSSWSLCCSSPASTSDHDLLFGHNAFGSSSFAVDEVFDNKLTVDQDFLVPTPGPRRADPWLGLPSSSLSVLFEENRSS